MPQPIEMIITAAGFDALVDAQAGRTEAIRVTAIGLSERAFVPAGTLTAVPDEFKRLGSVSGQSVSERVIHMTAQDAGQDSYDLRGLGLYLEDGTLFAVYAQPDPIFRKVGAAAFLLAFDIAFDSAVNTAISFGDAVFLYPPASETVPGVAEIATIAETQGGVDDSRIVTPRKLAAALDVVRARSIVGAGLATGGGDLTADRAITVESATDAQAIAGTNPNVAVTPPGLAAALSSAFGARSVTGGGLASGGGTLAANRTITVTAATEAQALAGAAVNVVITPATLNAVVGGLRTRKVLTAGLATGGGDLTADRTIAVPAATPAQALAGILDTVALTPAALGPIKGDWPGDRILLPGGLIIAWAQGPWDSGSEGSTTVNWTVPFPTACAFVMVGTAIQGASNSNDIWYQRISFDLNGVGVQRQRGTDASTGTAAPIILGIGY